MAEKKGRKAGMRHLTLLTVLLAALFGLALFAPGESYAGPKVDLDAPDVSHDEPEGPFTPSLTEPGIQIAKVDEKGEPVVGATLELWRIQTPREYFHNHNVQEYDYLLGLLQPHEKMEEGILFKRVDRWETEGEPRVVDLSEFYPKSYEPGQEPYNFKQNDYRFYAYNNGLSPFCYMIIETDTPTNYLTAKKMLFRVDPSVKPTGVLEKYTVKQLLLDPRETWQFVGATSDVTEVITVTDEKTPLLVDKLDQNGKHLEGAELELLDERGEPVTDGEGKAVKWTSSGETDEVWIKRPSFTDEVAPDKGGPVTYTIRESKAPEGYEESKDVTFTIYPDGRWDYADESRPAIGHKPTTVQEADRGTDKVIPYVHTDPVRIIDFKIKEENGTGVGNFTINKTDQDLQPLSEVAFAVYGKPKMTATVNVDIKKHWEYEGASTVTARLTPEEHALVDRNETPGGQPLSDSQPMILKPEGKEKSFPHDYMAGLYPKVMIMDGLDVIDTMEGKTLKEILGADFDQAQYDGEKIAGPEHTYNDRSGKPTVYQGNPYWYYRGAGDEKLGTLNLREGEAVSIREELGGSSVGETVEIMREKGYSGTGQNAKPKIITIFKDTFNISGIGTLYGQDVSQYNNYNSPIPIPPELLLYFKAYNPVVNGNLVRHITPDPVVLEFSEGKLLLTDKTGTHDITDSCEVVLNNTVQWRTQTELFTIGTSPSVVVR